jgi:hypothetical protein
MNSNEIPLYSLINIGYARELNLSENSCCRRAGGDDLSYGIADVERRLRKNGIGARKARQRPRQKARQTARQEARQPNRKTNRKTNQETNRKSNRKCDGARSWLTNSIIFFVRKLIGSVSVINRKTFT